jgi:hypothetical protein
MKYVDAQDYDKSRVDVLLNSDETIDKVLGMITTVNRSGDYVLSNKIVSQFLQSENEHLLEKATECIGHLVRIFGVVDMDHIDTMEKMLISEKENYVDEPLEDIWIYHISKLNNLNEFAEFENAYKYWSYNKILSDYMGINPNRARDLLNVELNNTSNKKLKTKILGCLEHIELFR